MEGKLSHTHSLGDAHVISPYPSVLLFWLVPLGVQRLRKAPFPLLKISWALEGVFILGVDPYEEIQYPVPLLTTEDMFNTVCVFSDDNFALQILM